MPGRDVVASVVILSLWKAQQFVLWLALGSAEHQDYYVALLRAKEKVIWVGKLKTKKKKSVQPLRAKYVHRIPRGLTDNRIRMTQNGRPYHNFIFHPHKWAKQLFHWKPRTLVPLEIKHLFGVPSAKLSVLTSRCSKRNEVFRFVCWLCFFYFLCVFSTSWK